MKKFTDFYEAWHFLCEHAHFEHPEMKGVYDFESCYDIEVVKVNPKTKYVDDDKSKNTETNVWIECGPNKKDGPTHEYKLDCGGKTFEEAIINLANKVKRLYGCKKVKVELLRTKWVKGKQTIIYPHEC